MPRHRWRVSILAALAVLAGACGSRDPSSPEAKRERGEAILKAMSDRLASAKAITVTATEDMRRTNRAGEARTEKTTRAVALRRPDRLYMKVTGSRDFEAFYDGGRITLVAHREKVFGEFKAPPTIDETVDVIGARYGIPLPLGDLLMKDAVQSLMGSQTTGGWAGRDTIDGTSCQRLEWQHPNVDWTIWVTERGEPLPCKLHIVYKSKRGTPDATLVFKDWNLNASVTDATFARRVPEDYEGVAVIQRAAAVTGSDQPKAEPTSGRR